MPSNGIIIILAAIGILAIVGCQTVTSTATGYSTATLTHWGFDFATGARTDEAGKYDGETITWNPDAVTTTVEGTTDFQINSIGLRFSAGS